MKTSSTVLVLGIVIILSCKQTQKENPVQPDSDLATLFSLMQGSFNSEKQSSVDTTYYNISLHMYPIWEEKGNWLYVEQALNAMQDKPYRQRIYEVKRTEDGQLASFVYTIPNDSLWIGKWKTPIAFDSLENNQLVLRDGCEVLLKKIGDSIFSGQTRDKTCESSLRGASYAMSAVTVNPDGIKSWDQGFDAEGTQVWGATEGGYIFDKLE